MHHLPPPDVPPGTMAWIGVTPRQLAGFLAMVFGMFMAILDIQIVSASLTEIQAGLSASSDEIPWVQTAYLIAEVVMIPLSGFLARALSTRVLFFCRRRRLHGGKRALRHGNLDRPDDRLPGDPGLHRRRHDPERLRGRLLALSAVEARHRLADHRPRRDAGADDRPDGRRLPERHLLLALAVPGQRRPGHPRRDRGLLPRRLRQARSRACCKRFDFVGLGAMALFLGSLEYVLEEGPRYEWFDDRTIAIFARSRRSSAPSSSSGAPARRRADRRAQGLQKPQLCLRIGLQLHDGHRPLRPDLCLSGLSCAGARLRCA